MYYEIFAKLCYESGVKPADVSKATGISTATLSSWKTGKYTPKQDKLQKIADYFGVSLEYMMTGKSEEKTSDGGNKYYFSDSTAPVAQVLYENKDMRILFDAARDSKPEDLQMAADLLRRFLNQKGVKHCILLHFLGVFVRSLLEIDTFLENTKSPRWWNNQAYRGEKLGGHENSQRHVMGPTSPSTTRP